MKSDIQFSHNLRKILLKNYKFLINTFSYLLLKTWSAFITGSRARLTNITMFNLTLNFLANFINIKFITKKTSQTYTISITLCTLFII